MKYILVTMCTLVILFMGGCSLTSLLAGSGGTMFAVPSLLVTVLNLLVLGNMFNWQWQWRPASYILGVADLLIALAILFIFGSGGLLFFLLAGVIAIKGILTLEFAIHSQPPAL